MYEKYVILKCIGTIAIKINVTSKCVTMSDNFYFILLSMVHYIVFTEPENIASVIYALLQMGLKSNLIKF